MKCQEIGDKCPYGLTQPEQDMCDTCKTIREIRGTKRKSKNRQHENLEPTEDYTEIEEDEPL